MSTHQTTGPDLIDCPKCAEQVACFDQQNSTHFVCPNCSAYFQVAGNKVVKTYGKFLNKITPLLQPGQTCTLRGQKYLVTGWMQRRELKTIYQWLEYMLRNEATGEYAQLAEFEGHWMLITASPEVFQPDRSGTEVFTDERIYRLYNRYQPELLSAGGEFDWNIREDEDFTISEYVAPPYLLVREQPKSGPAKWYQGIYLEPQEVAEGFGLEVVSLPDRIGIGALQPTPFEDTWPVLYKFSLLMALLVVATQLFFLISKPQKLILDTTFSTGRDLTATAAAAEAAAMGSNRVEVSSPFAVQGPAALEISVGSELSNQWMEVPATLVNERTGQQYEFTKSLEHYFGVEGGESWSEGDANQDATLTNIPTGTYHLNLYPATENGENLPLAVKVMENTPLHSNAVLALLAILLYPGYVFWRRSQHEQQRWANSDFGSL